MDTKLDTMAAQGQLDAALMLTLAKAHNSVKDTDYTREEVKDVMAHLYFKVGLGCGVTAGQGAADHQLVNAGCIRLAE